MVVIRTDLLYEAEGFGEFVPGKTKKRKPVEQGRAMVFKPIRRGSNNGIERLTKRSLWDWKLCSMYVYMVIRFTNLRSSSSRMLPRSTDTARLDVEEEAVVRQMQSGR